MGALFLYPCGGVKSNHRRWFIRGRFCRPTDARRARAAGPVHSTHHHQTKETGPIGPCFSVSVWRGEVHAPKVVHPSPALPADRRPQGEGRRPGPFHRSPPASQRASEPKIKHLVLGVPGSRTWREWHTPPVHIAWRCRNDSALSDSFTWVVPARPQRPCVANAVKYGLNFYRATLN